MHSITAREAAYLRACIWFFRRKNYEGTHPADLGRHVHTLLTDGGPELNIKDVDAMLVRLDTIVRVPSIATEKVE